MATLTGSTIASSYDQLLALPSGGLNSTNLVAITDGNTSTAICLQVSTDKLLITDDAKLYFGTGSDAYIEYDEDGTDTWDFSPPAGGMKILGSTAGLIIGVDDTGNDVRVYSATASEGLHYDASEDELGLLLTTKLKFHDIGGGEEIYASANGHLEINSGTTLDCTAPTIDLNASTAITLDGDVLVGNGKGVVIGHTAQETISIGDGSTDLVPELQMLGTGQADSSLMLASFSTTATAAGAPLIALVKGGHATIGSHTVVTDGEELGNIIAFGDDGTDLEAPAAMIQFEVDGTPGTGDMPGRIIFATTTDAGETLSERMRINALGIVSLESSMKIKEQSSAPADTAAYGQLWVKSDTPTSLYFTTDAGNDVQLTTGSAVNAAVSAINSATANRLVTIGATTTELDAEAGLTFASNVLTVTGNILPEADGTRDLGSASYQWQNIYTGDLNLSNVNRDGNEVDGTTGSWTIQEGQDSLFILNRQTGKQYKFNLEEID